MSKQMEYDENITLDTMEVDISITQCENHEELRELISSCLKTQKEQWKKRMNLIFEKTGSNKSGFARLCGVSRQAVDSWCKGSIPKRRETFIRIGLAAGYDKENINNLLTRYGRYPELYSKTLEDCVCLFVLNLDVDSIEDKCLIYRDVLDRIIDKKHKQSYEAEKIKDDSKIEIDNEAEIIETEEVDKMILDIKTEKEIEEFINQNRDIFNSAYKKLYAYTINFINNSLIYNETVNKLSDAQGWSASLRKSVSEIRQKKWIPTRDKIISLGLHLCLTRDDIDELLKLAHMRELYSKNIFESVIIYVAETASITGKLDEFEYTANNELSSFLNSVINELKIDELYDFVSELGIEVDSNIRYD